MRARDALRETGRDLRWSWRQFLVSEVAGHRLVPRGVRHALYHAAGVRIDALDVSSGVRITGGRELTIGPGTFVNHACYFDAIGGLRIGRDCAIGHRVMIITTSHPVNGVAWSNELVTQPVVIGDRVWLGAGATVLPGVTIADDVIVAAGAVVASSIPMAGIYGGVPARLIKKD